VVTEATEHKQVEEQVETEISQEDLLLLQEIPFCLIPEIPHLLIGSEGDTALDKFRSTLKWQKEHAESFHFKSNIDVVLKFSEGRSLRS